MKEKIEKVIKEVGINEVESILNDMKSKVDIKESLKADFIKHLTGCNILIKEDYIKYKKDNNLIFYHRKSDNYFSIRYKIWVEFESKYSLNYKELRNLFIVIVEEVLNYKGVTPSQMFLSNTLALEEELNYNGVIPNTAYICLKQIMGDILNYTSVTPISK